MSKSLQYTIFVSLGGFIFGFDASVISGVVTFVANEFQLNELQQGFVVSSPTLGGIIATFCAGPLADAVGRKRVLLVVAGLYVVSAALSALATSFELLVTARIIGGMAFCSLMLAPMYIAEISEPEKRGQRVSINQLNIVFGLSAAYFSNFALLRLSGLDTSLVQALGIDAHTWRWMLGVEVVPATLFFLLLMTIPESPRWLMLKGRMEEAKKVLAKLMEQAQIDAQLSDIQHSLDQPHDTLGQRLRILFSAKMRMVIVIGLIVGIAQQATGVNAIYFYAPSIFEQSGVGTDAAFAQAIWIGIINIVFTIVAMALIDKVGRKPLLITGLAGVFISMSLCAYGFNQATYQLTQETLSALTFDTSALTPLVGEVFNNDVDYKNALRAALGDSVFIEQQGALIQAGANINAVLVLSGILGFVASFAVSLGPVMWVLFSEIFPNQVRGIAISAVGIVNSFVSFLVQQVFPWELANMGNTFTFLVYGLFALAGLVLVMWLVPETKGKTLEELEQALGVHGDTSGAAMQGAKA